MDIKSSIIGSCVAEIATLPICTIKTVRQTTGLSAINSVKKIYNSHGWKSFYNASFPAVSAQIFSSTYKLTMFNYLKTKYNIVDSKKLIYIGIFTSLTCIFFTHPMDYFRIMLQNNNRINLKEIYRGFSPNICKAIIGGAMFLPLRETLKNNLPLVQSWKIGIVTAIISTIVMHPFDFFKTFMIGNFAGDNADANAKAKIPFRNPYRGLSLNIARIVPHFVIMTEVADMIS